MHLRFDGDIVVVGDRYRCIAMQRHELRTVLRNGHFTLTAVLQGKHPVLKRYGVFALQDFPDQLIVMREIGKKIVQADNQFVGRTL